MSKKPFMTPRITIRPGLADAEVDATVDQFLAIGEDPAKFKAFVGAAEARR
jgi:hypothetical protein